MKFFKDLFGKKKTEQTPVVNEKKKDQFDTTVTTVTLQEVFDELNSRTFQKPPPAPVSLDGSTMDAAPVSQFSVNTSNQPIELINWYASQSFIQYQLSAILSQQWLIDKACTMPAKDSIRKGYDVTVNDGTDVPDDVLAELRKYDVTYNVRQNLLDFIRFGRIFGIRIALFLIDSNDPKYYEKPFNPDGVRPGSYKGITQIDPYWITPQLDADAAANPWSKHFYEPTWWYVNGLLVHHTHLVIFTTGSLPDILKPTYIYGGVPIPQKIWERVYAAERTADEAPALAMTKRLNIYKVDEEAAMAKQDILERKLLQFQTMRNNYGTKVIGMNEEMTQTDTSLADLDDVIMSQYQLVAAAANVPAVKLLGTSPKGFNATGEYEEASYHEELESLQTHDLTPLLDRHNLLLIRSEIAPKYGIKPFETTIVWKPLDSMTAAEQALVNKTKAETDAILAGLGALDGEDIRGRVIIDPDSGYNGLDPELPDPEEGLLDEPEANEEDPAA